MKNNLAKALDKMQDTARKANAVRGIATGFHKLDRAIGGLQQEQVVVVGGLPSIGKTALCLSMAKNIALDGVPCAYFGNGENEIEIVNKILTNISQVDLSHVANGLLEKHEWQSIDKAIMKMQDMPLTIGNIGGVCSMADLREDIDNCISDMDTKVFFIEDISALFFDDAEYQSVDEKLADVMRELKRLASTRNVTIVVTADISRPISREIWLRDRYQPAIEQLNKKIEDVADVVLLVHRWDYIHIYENAENKDLRNIAEIIVAKNRNGRIRAFNMGHRLQYAQFCNVEDLDVEIEPTSEILPPPLPEDLPDLVN